MFSYQEIAHFRSFGFVALRGLLDPGEAAMLREEVVAALTDAYGGVGRDPAGGGIGGQYLPLSVDRAPLSQSLIADDPRLFQGSATLLGRPTVPTAPMATCFTGNAGWHTDDGTDVGGVKFLAYLDPRSAGDGALQVVPGSHQPGFADLVEDYLAEDPARQGFRGWPVPCAVLETHPGDVVAFDVHLFHGSAGGHDRLAWSIEYRPWPGVGDPDRVRAVRDVVNEAVDYQTLGYDSERWPTWSEWVAAADGAPPRQVAVERLRLLGVLGAPTQAEPRPVGKPG